MSEREFDIVLWGATGATGRRAAHHLARRCEDSSLRLAIGGRNSEKLAAIREELPSQGGEINILVGDSLDPATMKEIATNARVVASTVGPFALYGSPLVAACVESGTHYCNLTAEPQWMRAMIDAHEPQAVETGARVVHVCGHDSIPSDLGVQFLQQAAMYRHGQPCKRVATRVTQMKGGFSGGTAASFLNAMRLRETDPGFSELSLDPYALCPEGDRDGPDGPDRMKKVLPKSGEGPSKEVRESGSYEIVIVGETPDGEVVKARITGQGDPGVRSTTLMLTEAALCLAQDRDHMTVSGGFWTPAAALGSLLRDRVIAHAGISFELLWPPIACCDHRAYGAIVSRRHKSNLGGAASKR